MKIAVAGGSGVVGRHVVAEAERRGREVLVLSRATGTDLTSATGLADRLSGVDAVVDVTSTAAQSRVRAEAFFGSVTRTLLAAEAASGVGHHLALSIIGIDRVGTGYYRGKLLQERLVEAGRVPWTILRASQFHEFAEQALGFVTLGPLSIVPAMTVQPIAAREVAAALVDAVDHGPCGRLPDLAGPDRHQLVDLARRVNDHLGLGRRVIGVPLPGAAGRRMRAGDLTPSTRGPRGHQSFDAWLAERTA